MWSVQCDVQTINCKENNWYIAWSVDIVHLSDRLTIHHIKNVLEKHKNYNIFHILFEANYYADRSSTEFMSWEDLPLS